MSRDWRVYPTWTAPAVDYAIPAAEKYVDSSDLAAMCLEAMRDQQKTIEDQTAEIEQLYRSARWNEQIHAKKVGEMRQQIDSLLEDLAAAKGYPDAITMLMREPVRHA